MSESDTFVSSQNETAIVQTVFPSMVNHYGTLFGGIALQWMDHAAWVCSTRHARKTMVTIASDKIVFKKPVPLGNMVELRARVVKTGNTSLTVEVKMFAENPLTGDRNLATQGEFVMVAVGEDGKPVQISSKS